MGLEPTTFGSEVRRAIHYATRPLSTIYNICSSIKVGGASTFMDMYIRYKILAWNLRNVNDYPEGNAFQVLMHVLSASCLMSKLNLVKRNKSQKTSLWRMMNITRHFKSARNTIKKTKFFTLRVYRNMISKLLMVMLIQLWKQLLKLKIRDLLLKNWWD